jgi:hypothetical protein
MNFLLSLARLRNVVGGLHPHQRVHLHPECFLDTQRHLTGQRGLGVKQTLEGRPGNLQRRGSGGHRQPCGYDNLRPDKIARMRRGF